jgi:hypothetical protein
MTLSPRVAAGALPERPPISAPHRHRDRLARQPGLGLAGITLVVPVAVALGVGLGTPERSLLVLGPISTFALPIIAMIAFWWEDWPGTALQAPLSGLANTVLVVAGGVLTTLPGQAIVDHPDLRGIADPAAGPADAPAFPATMPLAGAIFVAMLQLTLVSEGWPLRRLGRVLAGVVALAAAWGAGVGLYELVVRSGWLSGGELGAGLVCVGALQVAFYVVLRGWPFRAIASRAVRLPAANAVTLAGGGAAALGLLGPGRVGPATAGAVAGSVVAAGLLVGMLFDGWIQAVLSPGLARVGAVALLAAGGGALYLGLQALAETARWTRAEPAEWVAYAGLNAIGAGVILHVAIGRRWPFASPAEGAPEA